jgi:mannonate dehydratase
VCEAIKYGGAERDRLIENYKVSLANLGRCGIHTICYNFMPVLDWARTELDHKWEDGSTSLFFNKVKFVYFDCYILKRENAEADYTDEELCAAAEMDKTMTDADRMALVDTIIVKTQGFVNGNISEKDNNPVELFRNLLSLYKGITRDKLRENMKYFLEQIMPVCDEWGMNMCVHPDDPPFPVLGLPRIVTSEEDIEWLLNAVDNPHNGLTFCVGSLGCSNKNDVVSMAAKYAKMGRIHFVHMRNVAVLDNGFEERAHLSSCGSLDMYEVARVLTENGFSGYVRPDHGRMIWGETGKPGYGLFDRALGATYINGLFEACEKNIKE